MRLHTLTVRAGGDGSAQHGPFAVEPFAAGRRAVGAVIEPSMAGGSRLRTGGARQGPFVELSVAGRRLRRRHREARSKGSIVEPSVAGKRPPVRDARRSSRVLVRMART
jgi:hypothetical protein